MTPDLLNLAPTPTSAPAAPAPGAAGRLHFLDHLRAVIILLVIVLHASITYMVAAPQWWYVLAPQNSLLFTVVVLLVDVPIMQILFFIAGFFAYTSLEKHGAAAFLRQKAIRLGLPWVVGVVFLAPPVTYLITVTNHIARPYLQFWATDFWGTWYQQSVYWYLGILLLLFAGLAALRSSEPRLQHLPRQAQMPTARLFITFWAFMTVWYFMSSAVLPADSWFTGARLFVFQPARLLLYGGYFALGVYADRRGWFRPGGFQPDLGWWGPVTFVSAVLYLGSRLVWPGTTSVLALGAQAAFFNAFCLTALMAATAFFQRYVNQPTRLWTSLARNAYAIYYIHPLILYPAAYLAVALPLSIYPQAVLLMLLTALAAWAFSALVLTRWPLLRAVF